MIRRPVTRTPVAELDAGASRCGDAGDHQRLTGAGPGSWLPSAVIDPIRRIVLRSMMPSALRVTLARATMPSMCRRAQVEARDPVLRPAGTPPATCSPYTRFWSPPRVRPLRRGLVRARRRRRCGSCRRCPRRGAARHLGPDQPAAVAGVGVETVGRAAEDARRARPLEVRDEVRPSVTTLSSLPPRQPSVPYRSPAGRSGRPPPRCGHACRWTSPICRTPSPASRSADPPGAGRRPR